MRKTISCMLLVAFLISGVTVFAAEGGKKGASSQAYEHASEEAIFHRVGDWFSTLGKSKEEKAAIIAERRAQRAAARAEKEAAQEAKKAEKKASKTAKKAEKKLKDKLQ
ncbi:MAG: hypothetical protein JW869_00860 [Candidatus Omnitrophica bacterium]|nr:hypothetical protein [Candidatus Omnitrophota bacterium]